MLEYREGLTNVKTNEDTEIYKVTDDTYRGHNAHVLMEGDYEGRHFAILRHTAGFPDAYIQLKPDDYIMVAKVEDGESRYELYDGEVHGGATFLDRCYWNESDTRFYLGWDYAHAGDFMAVGSLFAASDRKWTLPELLMSIAQVEAHITRQNRDHWKEIYDSEESNDGT